MSNGIPHGVVSAIVLSVSFFSMWIGCSDERERWCEHLHEKHEAVERCQDEPDWREGEQ